MTEPPSPSSAPSSKGRFLAAGTPEATGLVAREEAWLTIRLGLGFRTRVGSSPRTGFVAIMNSIVQSSVSRVI